MPPLVRPRSAAHAAAARETTERSVAEALLGAGHPLTRVLGRLEAAFEQLVWVTAVQAGGMVFFLRSQRLRDERTPEQLAGLLDGLVEAAERPGARAGAPPPLADGRMIRAAAREMREVAALLRGGAPAVEGVALVDWLVTSPVTPLYGTKVEPLRHQLSRARYLLTSPATSDRSPP